MNGAAATAAPTAASFRLRGTDVTRVESLSDVVFGFALTLLVVSLQVPRTFAELIQALRGFPAFAICFWMLLMIWRAHHRFFRRYGLHDEFTIVLNGVLLFLIVFYVYPLKFLFFALLGGGSIARNSLMHIQPIMVIFGLGFASVYVLLSLLYLRAYSQRSELTLNRAEVFETRTSMWMFAIVAAIGLLVAITAALTGSQAGNAAWWFILIQPVHWGFQRIRNRRLRKLELEAAPT